MSNTSTVDLPGGALNSAMEAVKDATADAAEAAAKAPEEIRKLLSRTVYGGFYYLSYGAVFSALTLARLIPKNSAVARGIRDGAAAARETFEAEEKAESPVAAT